ncbi:MAG: hypothetical protein J3Q66DRAFT_339213 [Benniella sp.]|nr:MAG: hypothetical protein J3Q66DRAFT_339213 [Benniella sp.]
MPTISAPIPIPGTQQMPTVPALRVPITTAVNSSTMPKAFSGPASPKPSLHMAGSDNITQLASTLGVSGSNNSAAIAAAISLPIPALSSSNSTSKDNSNSGLRRLPTLGNIKRLTNENQAQQAKIQELERYLWGLKEALIIAREQVHSKDQEAKQAEERKAVEIHELGQHIQRCETTLSTKTVECDNLKNQLQHQSKEQVSKLKHIRMLETEIRDYRRMSIMSGGTIAGDRNSICRFSTDLSETIGSSMIFGGGVMSTYEEIKQLKEENTQKEQQIEELMSSIEKMKSDMARLEEKQRSVATPLLPPPRPPRPPSAHMMLTAGSDACFPYIPPPPHAAVPPPPSVAPPPPPTVAPPPLPSQLVNSVGYNIAEEHPKLLARYQSLSRQHASASEYVEALEFENCQLKVEVEQLNASRINNRNSTGSMDSADHNAAHPTAAVSPSSATATALPSQDSNPLSIERSSSTTSSSSLGSTVSAASTAITPIGSPTVAGPTVSTKSLRYSKDGMTSMSPVEMS